MRNAEYQQVIAIDGPAAAGKTTVARGLADRLGFTFFDTGSLYRALTNESIRRGIDPGDGDALAELAGQLHIEINSRGQVIADGREVTAELRAPEVDRAVSRISAHPQVRLSLLPVQRAIASSQPVVMVGRDIATVVVPEARYKVFLEASAGERARRRYDELRAAGGDLTFDQVLADIERRDHFDSTRPAAPLKPAPDAVVLDTDGRTVDEVIDQIASRVEPNDPVLTPALMSLTLKPEYFADSAKRSRRGKVVTLGVWPWISRLTRLTQEGLENVPPFGPLLYVSNHLHNTDPILEFYAYPRPLNFMGKQELFDTPVLKQISELSGGFPVDRGKFDREALKHAEDRLVRGLTVGIYPEGTRSVTGSLTEAKAGAGLLALKAGVPILPVAITGSERLPFNGAKGGTASSHDNGENRKTGVHIVYGEPFLVPRMIDGRKVSSAEATDIIMLEIARLLPPEYRGVYRERLDPKAPRLVIPYSAISSSLRSS